MRSQRMPKKGEWWGTMILLSRVHEAAHGQGWCQAPHYDQPEGGWRTADAPCRIPDAELLEQLKEERRLPVSAGNALRSSVAMETGIGGGWSRVWTTDPQPARLGHTRGNADQSGGHQRAEDDVRQGIPGSPGEGEAARAHAAIRRIES